MTKKRLCSLILAASLLSAAALTGCNKSEDNSKPYSPPGTSVTVSSDSSTDTPSSTDDNIPEDGGYKTIEYESSKDKYRTFYEIFPYSFCDSNGDGKGDLNGITSKLDYLNDGDPKTTDDLGVDGIWLTPIMQSPSYHKYNVIDYRTVDETFGTNDDFKKLLDEAHKRGINVIIDLVINHTSRKCEWFQKAIEELKAGKTDCYVQYYNFEKGRKEDGWRSANVDDWYYEGHFDDDMPDLNLKNPDVRKEIEEIVKFWLDMGVDGFRLDAVMWFENTDGKHSAYDHDGSIEDLNWLYSYAKGIKEDVYMVGECWNDSGVVIANYYKSGLDSLFNFRVQGSAGKINSTVNSKDAAGYVEFLKSWQDSIKERNPDAIDAKFLSNHDTIRSGEFLVGTTKKRLAAALYLLAPGTPFIYYGEEIEMEGNKPDPNLRRGMVWSLTDDTGYVKRIPDVTVMTEEPKVSVESAQKDSESLLNFYKRLIVLRNQNPEIARGDITPVTFGDDMPDAAGYIATYNGSSVLVVFNLSSQTRKVTVPDTFKVSEVRGYALAHSDSDSFADDDEDEPYSNKISLSGQNLTMPAQSVFVLK